MGETSYTFTFKTPLKADPVGMWTVNGVKFDADAQAAVKAVKEAKNQVELLNALKSPYFNGVNADLIAEYFDDADRVNVATVEDVQKIIDKVNKEAAGENIVKAVRKLRTKLNCLLLFKRWIWRVNVDLIAKYASYDSSIGPDYKVTTQQQFKLWVMLLLKAAQDAVTAADTTVATALKLIL